MEAISTHNSALLALLKRIFLQNTQQNSTAHSSGWRLKGFSLLSVFIFLTGANGWGQAVLLDPAGSGGFEGAHGWTLTAYGANENRWYVGTSQKTAGTNGCYVVSWNATTTYGYDAGNTQTGSHAYKSISFPAGATNIVLSFKVKGGCDLFSGSCYDRVKVGFSSSAPTGNSEVGITNVWNQTSSIAAHTLQTVNLSSATYAGTTKNLVITWINDGSGAVTAGAIDEVSITYTAACTSLTSAGTVTGDQTICSGGDPAAFSSTAAASGGSGGTIEYQWESSTTSSSSGYSDISGAISATYDVPSGLSATTYYRRKARRCGGSYEQTTSALTVTVIKATRDAPTGAQCSGTTLNFSAVPAGATSYAWTVRTNGTVTYNSGSGFASNTSASVSSGSASSFSSALTNNTGTDGTFYVDVSITANGTNCTQVFSPTITSIPTTYYSKSSGNLNDVATWGSNSDGTGCSPANFTADGITYIIQNNAAPTTSGVWAVSGTGSIVKVGNGSSAITFTAGGNLTFTCDLEIRGNATLSLGSNNMTLSGDFVRSASTAGFSQTAGSASTVTFSGSSQEVNVTALNGTTPTDSDITFNHVTIDGASVKLFYFKTNDRKLNINNFTVNTGKVVTLYSNPQ